MKKVLIFFILLCPMLLKGQTQFGGFHISGGNTITSVNDGDPAPSRGLDKNGYLINPADGNTSNEVNQKAVIIGANLDIQANDKAFLATGLWFTFKQLQLRNTDGGYSGVSTYQVSYMQIPVTGKFYLKNFHDKFNLYLKAGPTFDLKIKEKLIGGDGAHYWNLAKNRTYIDPTRGKNGDNKSMALFNPFNIGLLVGTGVEYQFTDDMLFFGGFSYNHGFLNMINPSLAHNDINKTKVADNLKIRTATFTLDIGILFKLK